MADFWRDPRSSDSLRGIVFFPKKRKKMLRKLPGLATSGRHNFAMITDRRKFTAKWPLYWMSSFHFTVRIDSKSFLWSVRCAPEMYLPKFAVIVDGHRRRRAES